MENFNNSGHILNEDHSPSFFQNSCTGNTSEEEKTVGEIPENVDRVNEYVSARPSKVQGEIGWVKTFSGISPTVFSSSDVFPVQES